MSNLKIHFLGGCGRGRLTNEDVTRTTCANCKATPFYERAMSTLVAEREAAFQAQVPRTFREPWHQGNVTMVCKGCGGDQFRYRGRSCYGHYDDHVCANCGHTESRLTETGRCF